MVADVAAALPCVRHGSLASTGGHRTHYFVSGSAAGRPAVVLHGGPGSGSSPRLAAPFDSTCWRVAQFDQRGCGASTPLGSTENNHTAALIEDIEALRAELGVRAWFVAGGSWGAALALAYAARHREHVTGLLLRSVFLTGRAEIDAFFAAARNSSTDAAAELAAALQSPGDGGIAAVLDRAFRNGLDRVRQWRIACAWLRCESVLAGADSRIIDVPEFGSQAARTLVAKYRVQAHYLAHECFLGETVLLAAAATLSGLPAAIVHGSADAVCPPANARRVHAALRGSRLTLVPGAGHDPFHPGMLRAARTALAAFAADGDFSRWPASGRGGMR